MTTYRAGVLVLAAVLTAGFTHAQDASERSTSGASPGTACLIDDHLSVWLSLEAADRMVASLEKERRELTVKLAEHRETLQLMDEGRTVAEGVTVTQLGVLVSTETGGREGLNDTYNQIEARLTELDKTLKRRRMQRSELERALQGYSNARANEGL